MNYNFNNIEISVKMPKPKWWLSLPFIIFTFLAFFPIGIFLMWKRYTTYEKNSLQSGKAVTIIGCILLFGALVLFISSISDGLKEGKFGILFYLLSGISLILVGIKRKENVKKFKKYISIINNDEIMDIDNISAIIPASYENTKEYLQNMIDNGFFQDAYIDEIKRQIVFPKMKEAKPDNQFNNTEKNIRMKVVTCNGCGAQNSIATGTVGECEFCGSKIEA